MASRPREKMPVLERAKQFMPFAAVRGLDAALAQKERELERVEKRELFEETAEQLNETLCMLKKGMRLSVTYYGDGTYRQVTEAFGAVDAAARVLRLQNARIPLDDICSIAIEV
ncbi:MAG: YolD-like family protein [Clostridia bacterium]|nr:YolD-like family protein [Clostridia bacterium]